MNSRRARIRACRRPERTRTRRVHNRLPHLRPPQPVSQLLRPPAPARASALAARINNQPHLQRPLTDPLAAFAPNPGTYRPEPRKPPPLPARRYRVPSSARELMTARELQTRARLMPGSMPRDRLVELAMRVR